MDIRAIIQKGNSEFNRVSTAYLRLKSIEIGYTLSDKSFVDHEPSHICQCLQSVYNNRRENFVDPEHPDDDLGRMYPLNKTYTVGMSLSF